MGAAPQVGNGLNFPLSRDFCVTECDWPSWCARAGRHVVGSWRVMLLPPPEQPRRLLSLLAGAAARRASLAPLSACGSMEPPPGPERSSEPGRPPPAKKRRLQRAERRPGRPEEGERRYVPPPRKRNPGVSFGQAHFAETSYYFEGGLRKVRPYYFDFQTYCKGRWVGRSLLHVFGTEFRAQPLEYYVAAAEAGRLRLNEQPVRDLSVVLKASEQQAG